MLHNSINGGQTKEKYRDALVEYKTLNEGQTPLPNELIFTSRVQLIQAISDYIHYYNYERFQRRLSVMTPMEYHEHYALAA